MIVASGGQTPPKAHALVQLAAEGITCDLRVRSIDNRERSATYELVIANRSDINVTCRLYGMDASAHTREFGMLTVGKRSAGSSFFSVELEAANRRRIYVEVVGDGVNLFAEAFQPTARLNSRWPILGLIGVAATAAIGGTYVLGKPSVRTLGVPASGTPGTITAMYAIGGDAKARYLARTSDGHVLARGTLSAPKGELAIAVPPTAAGHTVRVSVEARGPLGYAVRSAAFKVVPEARRGPSDTARITSLSAHRQGTASQTNIVVKYRAAADRGTVRIIDSQGLVLASAPYSSSGESRVSLDRAAAAGVLHAELDIALGRSRSDSSVKIPAEKTAEPVVAVAATATRAPGVPDVAGAPSMIGTSRATDAFSVAGRVIAGQKFNVSIRRPAPGLRIAFKDGMEALIDEVAVPANASTITFSAPASPTTETYYLASTSVNEPPQETTVKSLRIYPH